jgi:hypothetical protein
LQDKQIGSFLMAIYVTPKQKVGRSGGSFQECTMNTETHSVITKHGRYCTIRDDEYAPPTSTAGRHWLQIFKTPDNTE